MKLKNINDHFYELDMGIGPNPQSPFIFFKKNTNLKNLYIVRLKFFLTKCSSIQKKWKGNFSWGLHKIVQFHLIFTCIIPEAFYPTFLFFVYFIINLNDKNCSRISRK